MYKSAINHIKLGLDALEKHRSRSNSPVRGEPKMAKKDKAPKMGKEKPTKIYVCRAKDTGKYKKCDKPKK